MKVIKGDIWKYHGKPDHWICIPTNGYIKNDGSLVMGRGLALQAAQRFPELPKILGDMVNAQGNIVFAFPDKGILTFPTKHNWMDKSDLNLIENSAEQIANYFVDAWNLGCDINLYLPKVGCGNGELSWPTVEPIVKAYLGDIAIVVDWS